MEYDKFLDEIKEKIAKACQIPAAYITAKQNKYDIPIPHCKPGDLFYCNKEDSEYYDYYIYIIGDTPTLEGTGYEYYMVKDGVVVKSFGEPRHIDDSIGNILVPIYDDDVKAKILLLTSGI